MIIKGKYIINLILVLISLYFIWETEFFNNFTKELIWGSKWIISILLATINLMAFFSWLCNETNFKNYKIYYDNKLWSPITIIIVPVLWIPYLFHCIYTFADKHLTFKL